MALKTGDYRLWVARPCRRKYLTVLRDLHREGLAESFESGLDGLIGDLGTGEVPPRMSLIEPPNVYAATIQFVRLHFQIDGRRMVVRIVRVGDLAAPLPRPQAALPGGSAGT